MMEFFDQQQRILADMLNDSSENTVGHFVKHFATGGLANSDPSISQGSDEPNILRTISSAAQKTVGPEDASKAGGSYGDSPLGQKFYMSAPYIAHQFTNIGKFFSGAEPGNAYTNHYATPEKSPNVKSQDPGAFYSRWYEGMRRFAQAEEVADMGQPIVRSR